MQTGSTHLQSSESSLQQPHKVTFPDSSHFKNCWTKPICQVQMQWNVNLRRAMKRGSKQAASRRENTQFYPNTPGPVVHTYNFVQVAHNWVCLEGNCHVQCKAPAPARHSVKNRERESGELMQLRRWGMGGEKSLQWEGGKNWTKEFMHTAARNACNKFNWF